MYREIKYLYLYYYGCSSKKRVYKKNKYIYGYIENAYLISLGKRLHFAILPIFPRFFSFFNFSLPFFYFLEQKNIFPFQFSVPSTLSSKKKIKKAVFFSMSSSLPSAEF